MSKGKQPEAEEPQTAVGDELEGTAEAGYEENGEGAPGAADPQVQQLTAELEAMRDRYLRTAAEMENVRRRMQKELEDARRFGNERLIGDLLPVLDNFGRALDAAEQTPTFEALKGGVDLIYRQFDEVLTRAGLERIEAVGQKFDPNLHEAIMQVPAQDGQEPHQVVEELRPGFKLHDRVVRPSLVKVTSA